MNSTARSTTPFRVLQAVIGAVVGLAFTWLIVNYIPLESGAGTLLVGLAAAGAVTAAVLVLVRTLRAAALGFAVSSALMLLLLAVVVV